MVNGPVQGNLKCFVASEEAAGGGGLGRCGTDADSAPSPETERPAAAAAALALCVGAEAPACLTVRRRRISWQKLGNRPPEAVPSLPPQTVLTGRCGEPCP